MPRRAAPRARPVLRRLGASRRLEGRGITIAFLDSGFFPHPDLVEPRNRIVRYVDLSGSRRRLDDPDEASWHGLMTSVVACGNGRLSRGRYRGLASKARLVLVKCGTHRRIAPEVLVRAFAWVRRHRRRYGIRIVSVSCGGDFEAPYLHDALSRAAEEASRAGLLVVAAAGARDVGRGHPPVLPPASAPSVLAVGGLDDREADRPALFASACGPTLDGLQKPDLLAPSVEVPAPILPGTPAAEEARRLFSLPLEERRRWRERIASEGLLSAHYKMVEGTSFACPIVASVAAQMLEANPDLPPHALRRILAQTARRLRGVSVAAQGWGAVDARAAVRAARASRHPPRGRR